MNNPSKVYDFNYWLKIRVKAIWSGDLPFTYTKKKDGVSVRSVFNDTIFIPYDNELYGYQHLHKEKSLDGLNNVRYLNNYKRIYD